MAKKKINTDSAPEIKVTKQPKVNDIAKPGETAAHPTARPVITGHGSMIKQDPMVASSNNDTEKPDEKVEKITVKTETKIKPINIDSASTDSNLAEQPAEEESPPANEVIDEDKTDSELEAPEPKPSNDEKPPEDKEKSAQPSSSDAAAIDSLATSAEAKKLSQQAAEQENQQQTKIAELIDSKQYNVNITEGGHKAVGQKIATWVLLILLLAAIGAYLAADAGYIDVGVDLPYDLIKNK